MRVTTATRMLVSGLVVAGWAATAWAQGEAEEAVNTEPVRTVQADFSVAEALQTRLALSIGEIVVRGEDVDRAYVTLQIFCERKNRAKCEKFANDLSVASETERDRVVLKIKGVSDAWLRRLSLRMEVRVPRSLPLDVHVHDGQIRIDDVRGSVKAEVDKGTIDVNVADADVGELVLKAGKQIVVSAGGETMTAKGTLSGELQWLRPGKIARIQAKADIGEVRVTLN